MALSYAINFVTFGYIMHSQVNIKLNQTVHLVLNIKHLDYMSTLLQNNKLQGC